MVTIGIDEVGRGCWAGPLVAGAVVLNGTIPGLRDSKKLSKSRRETLAVQIKQEAAACGLGWVEPAEIDELGITKSVELAMRRAYVQVYEAMTAQGLVCDEIIIDGNINYLPDVASQAIVKADDSVPAVSAASILAKVARDRYMSEVAHLAYPGYGFAKHVGYGTALHIAALRSLGPASIHRMTFKPLRPYVHD